MCLYPRLIKNPKYRVNKKNEGNVPEITDMRVGYVAIGCGYCFECMKQKAYSWKVRLQEDIKQHQNGKFVTLTFSNESYTELAKNIKAEGYTLDNEVARIAVRRFLERWRKKHKKSLRHWLVTELGQNNTENLHLHGILYTDDLDEAERHWGYGWIWKGRQQNGKIINYVTDKTINYITKYVTKADIKHKTYKPKIFCSPGIGSGYIDTYNAKKNKYQNGSTKTTYTNRQGRETNPPIYWRNKIYSEEEREKLWLQQLDKNVRYVGGEKIKADDQKTYEGLVKYYRKINAEMGYGSPENWDAVQYEKERRKLKQMESMNNNNNKKEE